MPRIFEDWEKSQYQAPTVEQSDAIEKQKAANATAMAQASNATPAYMDPYYIRDPKTGLSPAQVEANKAVEEAAKAAGLKVTPGATGPKATASRVSTTPVEPTKVVDNKQPNGVQPSGDVGTQFVGYEYNEDFTQRRAKYFNPATGQFTYGEWEDNPKTAEQYAAEQAAKAAAAAAQQQKADAFALIEATMRSYGFNEQELKEIIDFIQGGLTNPQMGPNQLALALRQLPAYKARFFGNQTREALGLNSLSEAEYLQQESDYSATFRQYGLQRFATRSQFANLIGNDVSNVELGKRVNMAVQRVQYGDPAVLKQLRTYYNITDTDIAAYYLNPKEVLPELEAKTTTAEIGATAASFGLSAEKARAEGLRAAGVDLTRARAGYETIAGLLPRTQELTQFYAPSGIEYTQTTAEEEQFKGTASAKRARERLKELETGSFSGSSGRGLLGTRTSAGLI